MNTPLLENFSAHPYLRSNSRGRTYAVPKYVVTIKSKNHLVAAKAAMDILEDNPSDLIIRMDASRQSDDDMPYPDITDLQEDESLIYLERTLKNDRRVEFAPAESSLDDYPNSPFHVYLECERIPRRKLIARTRMAMRGKPKAVAQDSRNRISITRSWFAHQTERLTEYDEDAVMKVTRRVRPIMLLTRKRSRVMERQRAKVLRNQWTSKALAALLSIRKPSDMAKMVKWTK